jgi:uncharacterized protein YbjT (DUF2867 family)
VPFGLIPERAACRAAAQRRKLVMKIVVLGGTGLIGRTAVRQLAQRGHRAVAASPTTGVNTVTRIGLMEALEGAEVVVDLTDSPSYDADAALEYFERSTRNLLRAEMLCGVRHHVALSIVGADRLRDSGYMQAKVAQESLVRAGSVPYTVLHSTQSFEAMRPIADGATFGDTVSVSPALVQPVAADDIAATLATLADRPAQDATYELAGPDRLRLVDLVADVLAAQHDRRRVVAAADAPYFGSVLDETTLLASDDAMIGSTHFADWLHDTVGAPPTASLRA